VSTSGSQKWWSRYCWEASHKLVALPAPYTWTVQEIKINEPYPKVGLAFELHLDFRNVRKHFQKSKEYFFVFHPIHPYLLAFYPFSPYPVCTHFDCSQKLSQLRGPLRKAEPP
jgi:hypothetical protein